MPRQLTKHKVNGCNESIDVTVIDEEGQGGACHHYQVAVHNPLAADPQITDIKFQNGPIAEHGTNGLTHEVLLAILFDRMTSFQAGGYACPENAMALGHVLNALEVLKARTMRRVREGSEGTSKPDA